jgi:hypothetical protein
MRQIFVVTDKNAALLRRVIAECLKKFFVIFIARSEREKLRARR